MLSAETVHGASQFSDPTGGRQRTPEDIGCGLRERGLSAVHGGTGMGCRRRGDFGIVGKNQGFSSTHAGISGHSRERDDLRRSNGLGGARTRARSDGAIQKSFRGGQERRVVRVFGAEFRERGLAESFLRGRSAALVLLYAENSAAIPGENRIRARKRR